MSEKLSCHIVKDLLPHYIDGLTSEETSQDIMEHLKQCKDCRSQYEAMSGRMLENEKITQERDGKEIDYLKKVRRRSRITALVLVCAALLVIAAGVLKIYYIGRLNKSVTVSVSIVNGKEIKAFPQINDSTLVVSGIEFSEENGVVTVGVRTCNAGLRKNNWNSASYTAKNDVRQIIDASGTILFEDGILIQDHVGRMFAKKVEYVGDAPAVSELLKVLQYPGMAVVCKQEFQLETSSRPYGIILDVEPNRVAAKDEYIKHACLLLALIENLDYVEYHTYLNESIYSVIKVTSEDALAAAKLLAAPYPGMTEYFAPVHYAESIKYLGKYAGFLQLLTDVLQLEPQSEPLESQLLKERLNTDIPEALARLGLSLKEDVSASNSVIMYQDGIWIETIDLSNGDMLTCIYELDGRLHQTSYLDRDGRLLYTLIEGSGEGITITEM
ncbi:MAG: DUF4825 domain-containing protein [Firmicutes bacterium]|nr:DUF4825 domain-containing protein [Bacillota bacterium]MBQ9826873.1 DUF4825 domain-containing protein [Bacillota bacterium]